MPGIAMLVVYHIVPYNIRNLFRCGAMLAWINGFVRCGLLERLKRVFCDVVSTGYKLWLAGTAFIQTILLL